MRTVLLCLPLNPLIILLTMIVVSACSTDPTETPVGTSVPSPRMTIVDTVMRAPTRTPVVLPTLTPHFYCEGAPESFLILSERGRVTWTGDDESLNMRSGAGTDNNILVQIEPLESFYVLDDYQCGEGYTWFKIRYRGRIGWIAEGDSEQYYAEPYLTG